MVYPPSVPPSDRTDSTVAAGKHATDHNQLASGLAAIIAKLGSNPAGSDADVTAMAARLSPAALAASLVRRTGRTGQEWAVQTDVGTRRLLAPPTVMATPPTITYGATFGSSTIPSAVSILPTDSRLRRLGLGLGAWNAFVSGSFTYYRASTTGDTSIAQYEFETDAPTLELNQFGVGQWNMTVNDQPVSATMLNSGKVNGDRYFTKVDFGSRAPRRIRLLGRYLDLAAILVGPTDTVWPPSLPAGPRFAAMTDSYGQGVGSLAQGGPFFGAAQLLGWRDVVVSSVGGTGYLNNNTTYTTFRQRIADVVNAAPDIVLTSGGINDQGRQTKAVLQAETTAYFAALRAALPNAVLIATGPWAPNQTTGQTANYTDVRDAIKAGLATVAGPWLFIDNLTGSWAHSDGRSETNIGGAWQTGTGKAGATTGTGNGDLYVGADGTHASSPAGVDYLGWRLARAIASGLGL